MLLWRQGVSYCSMSKKLSSEEGFDCAAETKGRLSDAMLFTLARLLSRLAKKCRPVLDDLAFAESRSEGEDEVLARFVVDCDLRKQAAQGQRATLRVGELLAMLVLAARGLSKMSSRGQYDCEGIVPNLRQQIAMSCFK
jgi:uncharacterized membrane protein YccC